MPILNLIVAIISGIISFFVVTHPQAPQPPTLPSPTSTIIPSPTPTTIPTLVPPKPTGAGGSTITVVTPKGDFKATVLSLDLSTTRVIIDPANDDTCATGCAVLSLASFVARNGGFAGVNGTYFCPASYPECASKKNSFDFPVYNSRLGRWINGGNLFWSSRAIFYFDGSGAHYLQDSSGFYGGLAAGR